MIRYAIVLREDPIYLENDLENILKQPYLNYKGKQLSDQDKQRVLDMLDILLQGNK